MKHRVLSLATAIALATTLSPAPSSAGPVENGLRLGVDTDLYRGDTRGFTDDTGTRLTRVDRYVSLFGSSFGLSLGAVRRGIFFGGARFEFNYHNHDGDLRERWWQLQPTFEAMVPTRRGARPFGQLALIAGRDSAEDAAGASHASTRVGFLFSQGVHAFITDSFSVDPMIFMSWVRHVGPDSWYQESTTSFGIALSFTGWVERGESADEPDEAPAVADPRLAPAEPRAHTAAYEWNELDSPRRLSIPVRGGHLVIGGAPGRDSASVGIEFVRLVVVPRLAQCTELNIRADERRGRIAPLVYESAPAPGGVAEHLVARATPALLALISGAGEVELDYCGHRFGLERSAIDRIRGFYSDMVRVAATRGADWPAPRAPATAPPPPTETSTEDAAAVESPLANPEAPEAPAPEN